jgi:hypothetical protein
MNSRHVETSPRRPFARTARLRIVALLASGAVVSCGDIPEPGTPPLDPAPLYNGYSSYRTLDETLKQLPDRSSWHVLTDSKRPARGPCPRFDQFEFTVRAAHLGHKGTLKLTFINQRLESTNFAPDEAPLYVNALRASGITFDAEGQASSRPPTRIWLWSLGDPFVGWADTRFQAQTRAWISSCS